MVNFFPWQFQHVHFFPLFLVILRYFSCNFTYAIVWSLVLHLIGGVASTLPLPTPSTVTDNTTVVTVSGNGIVSAPSVPTTAIAPVTGSSNSQTTVSMSSSPHPSVEMMQAIFSYKAAHADELTFEEGAIITVLGRDEPEWWRGRLQSSGVEGLFPVNYVRPYTAPNTATTAVVKSSHASSQRVSQPSLSSRKFLSRMTILILKRALLYSLGTRGTWINCWMVCRSSHGSCMNNRDYSRGELIKLLV